MVPSLLGWSPLWSPFVVSSWKEKDIFVSLLWFIKSPFNIVTHSPAHVVYAPLSFKFLARLVQLSCDICVKHSFALYLHLDLWEVPKLHIFEVFWREDNKENKRIQGSKRKNGEQNKYSKNKWKLKWELLGVGLFLVFFQCRANAHTSVVCHSWPCWRIRATLNSPADL